MNNRRGIVLMIIAMAGFTLEDLSIKKLSATLSVGQILITFGICSSIVFAIMAHSKGHSLFIKHAWTRVTLTRNVAEAIAAVSFVKSLALVPLSTVAAVLQATPLVITMGAALFMGEKVGWRRWLAILIGFVGVLLIIKPGLSGFDPAVLLVLISVLGITVRDLSTRIISDKVASSVISFQAFGSLIIAGIVILFLSTDEIIPVTKIEVSYIIGGVFFGVIGYYGIVSAMRVGDASIVSPFRYTRLLFSLIVGVVVFHERPDFLTLTGAAIIICTGLYTFLRERRLERSTV